MFFFQYLVQAGVFFVVPLYLSVCLGLSALATGARLLPLSVTLLAAAIGIPRLFPNVSPRLVVRCGLLALLAGTVVLLGRARRGRGAGDRVRPAAPDRARHRRARLAARRRHRLGRPGRAEPRGRRRPEHDDEPRRLARDGARRLDPDRALLASSFLANIAAEPGDPAEREGAGDGRARGRRAVHLGRRPRGAALDEAGVSSETTDAALDAYQDARIDGLRAALAILALLALFALFTAQRIPATQPGGVESQCHVPLARLLGIADPAGGAARRARPLADRSEPPLAVGATTTNGDGFGVGWYDDGDDAAAVPQHAAGLERPEPARARCRHLVAALPRAHPRVDRHRDPADELASVPLRADGCGCTTG